MISLLFILHAAIILPSRAAESQAHGSHPSVVIDHKYIYQSHVFHSTPRAVIDSVLSDVREVTGGSGGGTVLDIDASSSQLDDDAIASLVQRLVPMLQETIRGDVKRKVVIKLALGMNRLTPSGASTLFDILSNNGVNAANFGNEATADDNVYLNDNTADDDHNAECATAIHDKAEELNGQMALSSYCNSTHDTSIQLPHNVKELDTNQAPTPEPIIELEELDLSFSDVGGHGTQSIGLDLVNSARTLFERGLNCHSANNFLLMPRVLCMENCGIGPAFCRSIGRGILNAFETQRNSKNSYRPSVLRIGGNQAIGDQGVVAIAAALRLAVRNSDSEVDVDDNYMQHRVLEELDLSSCNVGDTGSESLALAIACNPSCLSKLDLSNNRITDAGAKTIGRALVEAHRMKLLHRGRSRYVLEEIVLDNNIQIGDDGAVALAEAIACGAIRSISLRSCSVKAEGAAAFGKAISSLTKQKGSLHDSIHLYVDLSGNAFGTKQAKKKKGAAYSAGLLRDKASSHINYIGKTLQKGWREGLKGAGVSMGLTVENDDDEENVSVMGGLIDTEDDREEEQLYEVTARCGARSFSAEILNGQNGGQSVHKDHTGELSVCVAMRRCSLDDGAMDALSAAVTKMMKSSGTSLAIDVSTNSVDPRTMAALLRDKKEEHLLVSMAERHMTALTVMNEARERAALAAEAAVARADMERKFEKLFLNEDSSDFEMDQYDDN